MAEGNVASLIEANLVEACKDDTVLKETVQSLVVQNLQNAQTVMHALSTSMASQMDFQQRMITDHSLGTNVDPDAPSPQRRKSTDTETVAG